MAGGTYTAYNKRRPGAYVNVKANQTIAPSNGITRGVVFFVGGNSLGWGENGVITLNAASDFRKLLGVDLYSDLPSITVIPTADGMSVTTNGAVSTMLSALRETLKSAQTVLFYNINTGAKAQLESDELPWKFTAKYPGAVGNQIQVSVAKNPNDDTQTIVTTYFGTVQVNKQVITAASQLTGTDYTDVAITQDAATDGGQALLDAVVGQTASLGGGESDTAGEIDTDAMINAMETQTFNVMTAAGVDPSANIHRLLATTVQRLRDDEGQKVTAVVPDNDDLDADYEGIIVVANGVVLDDGTELSTTEVTGYVAGAEASAGVNASLTYAEYPNAVDALPRYNNEDTIALLEAGKLLFTARNAGGVVIEQDINSLHSYPAGKSSEMSKNRVMRVLDDIAQDTKNVFEESFIGKIGNDGKGQDLFKGNRMQYLTNLVNAGAIQQYDPADITVAQGDDLDTVIVTLAVTPIDSMEKLYMTISI